MINLRPYLSQIKFALGRNPVIQKGKFKSRFIPEGYETVVLISADFELAWAPRYDNSVKNSLDFAIEKAKSERYNLPGILQLCEKNNIPITWATVGHLFLDNCNERNGIKHPEIPPIKPYKGIHWDFYGKDWFEYDPCKSVVEAPLWYAPDLIRLILDSPVNHEIGCHTFSHIDCRDEVCPPELLKAELQECQKLAQLLDLQLSSFVHPGHTIGNIDVLANEGFTNYRTDYRNVLGYPVKHENGIWELEQTMEFRYYTTWRVKYQIYRYIEIIKRAIRSNTVCVFWFHPSFDSRFLKYIMPSVFEYLNENKDRIWVTTHSEYVNWLNRNDQ